MDAFLSSLFNHCKMYIFWLLPEHIFVHPIESWTYFSWFSLKDSRSLLSSTQLRKPGRVQGFSCLDSRHYLYLLQPMGVPKHHQASQHWMACPISRSIRLAVSGCCHRKWPLVFEPGGRTFPNPHLKSHLQNYGFSKTLKSFYLYLIPKSKYVFLF